MRIEVRSSSADGIEYRAFEGSLERTGSGDVVTISTGGVDRFNSILNPKGWHLNAYMKNPVVLWAHQRTDLPIAQAERVWVDGDKLMSRIKWLDDLNAFAAKVRTFYERGALRAWSVGFRPIKVRYPEKEDEPVEFLENELIEFSAVPVPANPNALTDSRSLGVRALDDRILELLVNGDDDYSDIIQALVGDDGTAVLELADDDSDSDDSGANDDVIELDTSEEET